MKKTRRLVVRSEVVRSLTDVELARAAAGYGTGETNCPTFKIAGATAAAGCQQSAGIC